MIQQGISDEELAKILIGATAAHIGAVHGGKSLEFCEVCIQLHSAMVELEAVMYPPEGTERGAE